MYSLDSLFLVLSDDNALAESESVSLDNCGVAVLLLEVGDSLVAFGEHLIEGCGNVILLHELLREHLRALDYSRICLGSEGHEALCLKLVDHSEHERVVGSDYYHVGLELLCELNDAVYVSGRDVETLGIFGYTAVSGSAPELADLFALCKLHDDSVLSSAAAYN